MRGASQFQQLTSLSPPFSGEALREESKEASLRDSRAGQHLPRGPLWPALGSPQEVQAWWPRTDDEVGVDVTEAAAERVDIIGALVGAGARMEMGTTDAEARVLAAETAAAEEITGEEEEMGVAGTEECSAAR